MVIAFMCAFGDREAPLRGQLSLRRRRSLKACSTNSDRLRTNVVNKTNDNHPHKGTLDSERSLLRALNKRMSNLRKIYAN